MNSTPWKVRRWIAGAWNRFTTQTPAAHLAWLAMPLLMATLVFAPWELRPASRPTLTVGIRFAPLWMPPSHEDQDHEGIQIAYGILLVEWAALGIACAGAMFLLAQKKPQSVFVPELRDWQDGQRRTSELVFEWAEGERLLCSVVRPYRRAYLIKRDTRTGVVCVLLPCGEFAVLRSE